MNRSRLALALAATVAVTGLAGATPALAQGGGGVSAKAACSTGTIALKAKHDNGRIQIESEVDTNRVGQVWAVTITDDKAPVLSVKRTTLAPSGSFTVRVLTADRAGADVVTVRATRGATVCTTHVSL